ncbi:LOW QUALITY PROTEIN: putative lipid scramblase CLPTM1 [Clytia hemisphaerica]|uniref:LOW QUALITY PROTEIN: putative lipid scramblase CLPTM1 n=1 Tax=Clytia hemisphaerica TaxID=252671 RepID=UPI0034D56D56
MADPNTSESGETRVASRQNTDTSVAETDPNVQQNGDQQQQNPQESVWKTVITRIVTFWIIMQVVKSFTGQKGATSPDSPSSASGNVKGNNQPCSNLFKTNDHLELYLYYSEKEDFTSFDAKSLLWHQGDIKFGSWYDGPDRDGSRKKTGKIQASESLMNNGSLYYHIFVVKQGSSPDPRSKFYDKYSVSSQTKLMTSFRKERVHKTKNLLTGAADTQNKLVQNDTKAPLKVISFWHPNLTISLLDDQTPWPKNGVPQPLDQYIKFDNIQNVYFPVVYVNDYWNYVSDYMPINDTTPELEFQITFAPISMFKWQLYISQSMRSQWNQYLGDTAEQSDQEQDMIKRILRETNPYLLALTMIVSLVHSVFEFLAFKNDIQFWKTRKSLEGLSVRSVFFNVFQTLVVLLYVFDNETNTVVVISCFVGLIIECWKITKVVDIGRDPDRKWGPFPAIKFEDKSTYVQSETREYDKLAFKYLSWGLFPLLACYAVYSLIYVEHKGWYSFVLSIAYGFLLTFGFIMMTPQLFINYKMKSVAHLPWRMLTYKALNTFIDDIFAFVIKMPTLYRLGCLRDDIIFFIYLYQRWIYRTDMSRVNEFGTSGEEPTETEKKDETQEAIAPHDEQEQNTETKKDR